MKVRYSNAHVLLTWWDPEPDSILRRARERSKMLASAMRNSCVHQGSYFPMLQPLAVHHHDVGRNHLGNHGGRIAFLTLLHPPTNLNCS